MSLFKCKMCGGDLEIAEGVTIAECDYCGTKQTVPKATDENLQNLFNRANTLRIKSEFDKAEKLYERIIQADSTQADAYWGLILCKYGIEYVDDPVTFKKIPTCHRASYDSIIADDDYKSALDNADMGQRLIYEEQAKEIDRIQKEILALAQKEENYDVFICYKETDANGQRTQDSVIANDIYYQLTQEGFKVFYAAITLEGKLGSAYEPIIFAALNSAKVMLAIGTKPEYFNAVWVKNEWSRYLKIIKNDRSKLLIPCYRDMDAYELPDEFAHLQAQDMAKIGFINDVVRGIQKVIVKDEPKKAAEEPTAYTPAPANIAPLLKRAFMFLEDGEWSKADEFCEQVLNQDPENAQAYLGKLMAELRVKTQESLKDCAKPFDDRNNYKKVIRFGDESLKNALAGYIIYINDRNETARLDGIYNRATESMNKAQTEKAFKSAAELFDSIKSYKDSAELAKKCYDESEISRKDAILAAAIVNIKHFDYEAAVKKLETIKGFKDADNLISECCEKIEQIKIEAEENRKKRIYNNAVNAMSQRTLMGYKDAIKDFESIRGYSDVETLIATCYDKLEELKVQAEANRIEKERLAEIERIEKAKLKKKINTIAAIVIPLVSIIIAALIILYTVIIPMKKYNDAMALLDATKYSEAALAFGALDGYKDSIIMISECKYRAALALMTEGKYSDAISAFQPLIGYKDSASKIDECNTAIFDAKYNEAVSLMNLEKYADAIAAFEALNGHKDSYDMIYECKYCLALSLMKSDSYSAAIPVFEALNGYKDSAEKIKECNTAILENNYNDAVELMNAKQYTEAISAFKALGGYKDSITKINECKYKQAVLLANAEQFDQAYDIFIELNNYKDSAAKAEEVQIKQIKKSLESIKVGDYIKFGLYEQNNSSYSKENIEWLVLEVKNGKALVISKYVLDNQPYNNIDAVVTWETCTLRKWLNTTFLNSAFSKAEMAMIPTVTVPADGSNYGNATQDKVFLLSETEAHKYFNYDLECKATKYAKNQGVIANYYDGTCDWWLRSIVSTDGLSSSWHSNTIVDCVREGIVNQWPADNDFTGVRPVMWIEIE